MGAWGPGLYANDDAEDLLSLIRAVLKLPQPLDELVELLRREAEDETYEETTFWLVLADQLEKKGIHHSPTATKAITLLTNGADLEDMRAAGADDADLKARAKSNAKLLARLKAPREERPRKTLKTPQRAVVAVGDYISFPTQRGSSRNPYFPADEEGFVQDGWGLAQVHGVGWEFEYLNWIVLLPLRWRSLQPPTFENATTAQPMGELCAGTLAATHFKRMQMSILGNQTPQPRLPQNAHRELHCRQIALNDISICNALFGLG